MNSTADLRPTKLRSWNDDSISMTYGISVISKLPGGKEVVDFGRSKLQEVLSGLHPLRETVKTVNKVEANPREEFRHIRMTHDVYTGIKNECCTGV